MSSSLWGLPGLGLLCLLILLARPIPSTARQESQGQHGIAQLHDEGAWEPRDSATFAFLTSSVWILGGHRIALRPDGSYRWTVFSDYLEHDEAGRWDFQLTGTACGCIHLSAGGVVRFQIDGDELWIRSDLYHPEKTVAADSLGFMRTARLTPVPDPPIYTQLLRHTWRLTRPEKRVTAERMRFLRDGRLLVLDEHENCISSRGFDLTGYDLTLCDDWGDCKTPGRRAGGSAEFSVPQVTFDRGLLCFNGGSGGVWRPESDSDSTQVLKMNLRGLSFFVEFPSHVDALDPGKFRFCITNTDGEARRISSIGLGVGGNRRGKYRYTEYAKHPFEALTIEPQASYSDSVRLEINRARWSPDLYLIVRSSNSQGPYVDADWLGPLR